MKKRRILKAILLSVFSLILLIGVTLTIIFYGRVSSMMSIKYKGSDLYTMNYKQNYHLDKALKANIKDGDDLINFVSDEIFFGYKIKGNIPKYGCSAYTTTLTNGDKIVGRNFDLKDTDTLSVYTHPSGGYKSISTISTDMVYVGGKDGIKEKSLKGRALLLAAPYICLDGVNEKGLSASLLDMSYRETHMDTGKPKLIVSLAIRLLLDRATNVNEAVNLLKDYDIQTEHGWTQHIFIADKSGNSVIVEWVKGEMNVIKYNVCTNYTMTTYQNEDNDYSYHCDRFDLLDEGINFSDKTSFTMDESFNLLEGVKQKGTEWSVVFNLTNFSCDYALNGKYDKIYHLEPKDY